tara:strand:+ start:159 stop:338 length:180 start_codon:yes stop_codon:yes gene_type:complete
MTTYEFSYKDNEGDLFETQPFNSLSEARVEMDRLWKLYDGDFEVVETWIYKNGEFVGRF